MRKIIKEKFPFFLTLFDFYKKRRASILLSLITIIFFIAYFESFRWPLPGPKATHGLVKGFSLLLLGALLFLPKKIQNKLKNKTNLMMVVFFLSYLVSAVFSLDLETSLLHLWYPFMALLIFLAFSVIEVPKGYFYFVILLSALMVFITFVFSFFSIIFRYSVDNIYYFLFLDHRANYFLSEVREYGKYVSLGPYILLAPLSIVFLTRKKTSFLRKFFSWLMYLISLLIALISNNRIDVLVIAIHFIFYIFLLSKKKLLILIIPSLLVVWFGLLVTQTYFGFNLEERILRPSDERDKQTVEMRFVYWQTALENFKNFPIFGTGPNTYNTVSNFPMRRYYSDGATQYTLKLDKGIGVHNIFIERLADTGLFGFFSFIIILFIFFEYDFRNLSFLYGKKDKETFKEYLLFSLASWTWILYGITDNGYGAQGFVSFFFLRGLLLKMKAYEKA